MGTIPFRRKYTVELSGFEVTVLQVMKNRIIPGFRNVEVRFQISRRIKQFARLIVQAISDRQVMRQRTSAPTRYVVFRRIPNRIKDPTWPAPLRFSKFPIVEQRI